MTPGESAEAIQADFGTVVRQVVPFRDEVTVLVDRERIVDVCLFCRDSLHYNFLSDISCTDWLDRAPRFDIVYHLTSLDHLIRLRLKVQADDGEAVPTVIPVWGGANWPEREVWDLFGVEFAGHPSLTRLLLPEGWIGHPLRKDYAQTQISLPRPRADKTFD
ncbi:MAG: NADH-quinone oxidoreductase subunit C [Chloroflexota bacterium]|nr:MAG: NADH-quinone oxidoreductase subunit C [Chloroflexota bacterium]